MKKNLFRIASVMAVFALLALVFTISMNRQNARASSVSKKPVSVFALEHQHAMAHNARAATNSYACTGASKGNHVIDVTEKIINDADSGNTNYWALDAYTRTIDVWNVGSDQYCATVTYNGTFAAVAGQQSPDTTATTGGILSGYETGTMKGSAQELITGPLDVSNPSMWPLDGKVNSGKPVNYACTGFSPGTSAGMTCSGYSDWVASYFDQSASTYSFSEPLWSFKYVGHNDKHSAHPGASDGVWIDAYTGESGDILDTSVPA